MATKVGLWEALYSAIADTLWEYGGATLLVRTNAAHAIGDTTLNVYSTDRFPAAGNVAAGGHVYAYTSKTATTFVGIAKRLGPTTVSGTAGLVTALRPLDVVSDESRSETQLDKLRQSFLLLYALDVELDTIGRNYGVPRPRGMIDDTYRALLQVIIAVEAGTIYAMEKALDAIQGVGNWSLWERTAEALERFKVFVGIPGAGGAVFRGKAFMAGSEVQQRTAATTVDVNDDVLLPYGVYLATDYRREGTNYALETDTGTTNTSFPQRLQDVSAGPFLAGDVGKPIILTMTAGTGHLQHWKIVSYLAGTTVNLGWATRADGRVDIAVNNKRLITDSAWFAPWVADGGAEATEIVVPSGPNAGTYAVTAYISPFEIEVGAAFPATVTDMSWMLQPNFTTQGLTYAVWHATASANTITIPTTLPAATDLWVDYTNVESAELLYDSAVNGDSQRPFYLFDQLATVRTVLDLIRPAGVSVETEIT